MNDAIAAAQARALGAPSRRAIVEYLARSDEAVSVAELTDHLELNHNAIRKHLTQLVAAGLVLEDRERRATPGRPRLLYRIAPKTAAGEEQSYRRLAVLLAEAMASGDDPAVVGRRATATSPTPSAGGLETVTARLAAEGFEPSLRLRGGGSEIVLGSCPFADAAIANPEAVCGLQLGLVEGLAQSVGGVRVDGLIPRIPHRGGCRVAVTVTRLPASLRGDVACERRSRSRRLDDVRGRVGRFGPSRGRSGCRSRRVESRRSLARVRRARRS